MDVQLRLNNNTGTEGRLTPDFMVSPSSSGLQKLGPWSKSLLMWELVGDEVNCIKVNMKHQLPNSKRH